MIKERVFDSYSEVWLGCPPNSFTSPFSFVIIRLSKLKPENNLGKD